MRREIIRSVALTYRPDVVLVDHMPHGAMGELVPTLEALARLPVRVVLGLRDILDAPEVVRDRWELEGAFDAVEQHYDEVLVYGSQDVFDVAAQYSWPATISKRLRYCGYVTAADSSNSSGALRTRYLRRRPNSDLIVAIAGGGADGYRLFDTLLDAVPGLMSQRPCSIVIVTGPLMPAPEGLDLMRRARGLPVHVLRSVSDTRRYLRAADLVVAMAGYNTSVESLGAARRALLVPRPGPSAEQQMRARLFAERGWVGWLPPAQLSPETLQQAIVKALAMPATSPAAVPDLNGRIEAVRYLNAAVEQCSSLPTPDLVPALVGPHLIES
jgi:predicted glycosyltransferase